MNDCNDELLFDLSPTEWDYTQELEVLPDIDQSHTDWLEFLKTFPSAAPYESDC